MINGDTVTRPPATNGVACRMGGANIPGPCPTGGSPTAPAPSPQPEGPWDRIGDILSGIGGGGISPPQPQQETVAVVPETRSQMNTLGLVLVLAALAAAGYWYYKRQKKVTAA